MKLCLSRKGECSEAEQIRRSHVNSLLFPGSAGSLEFERRAITTMDRGGAQVAMAARPFLAFAAFRLLSIKAVVARIPDHQSPLAGWSIPAACTAYRNKGSAARVSSRIMASVLE